MNLRLGLAFLLAAVSASASAADPALGRLFFTPTQRASLDVARKQRTRVTVATERTEQVVQQPIPQTITYGGMVRRSDGQTTVWLNDRAVDEQESADGATIVRRVRPDGAVTLEVPQSNRRVDLKVGQSVEVLSGSIGEGYARPGPAPKVKSGKPSGNAPTANGPESAGNTSQRDGNPRPAGIESGAAGQGDSQSQAAGRSN